ncbi:MAG: DNA gyrase subunit A, partial [Thermodesulfovibrionales bacterium]|nr:DNA gyrase subunit A [Thermodesulfovibrionales bacterium]
VYDALVRLAQDFNMRYPLVDGQGNFGSIDGDPAAAYRYTEARLKKITEEFLADIDKETVDFIPNFDETTEEPVVLPSKVPNLLINGSSGIAVGMATNIPPHNLKEVCDGLLMLLRNPETTIEELMTVIKGPDFPTGAAIYGTEGITNAYKYGKGIIKVRAKYVTEQKAKGTGSQIIVKEIPYQVNKAKVIEKIAELIRDRKLEGISAIRDESSKKEGIRLVIELKKGELPEIVMNNLFKQTNLETSFGIIMLALVNGQPKILNLKDILSLFLKHRHEVITRRTRFELRKALEKAHILEGLKIALDNLDEIIKIIRGAQEPEEARETLISRFNLTEIQAKAILDMRLQRLTGLERSKIIKDYEDTIKLIEDLKDILNRTERVRAIIQGEIEEIKKTFGDVRLTEIVKETSDITKEDLIPNEQVVITLTHNGYIKRTSVSEYNIQGRGGKGKKGGATKEDDYMEHMFICFNHDFMLFFTNKGRLFWKKVYDIDEAGRQAKGGHINNLLGNISEGEKIATAFNVSDFKEGYLVMFTRKGIIKKTPLNEYENPRETGIKAITLSEDDELIAVRKSLGNHDIIIGTKNGRAGLFNEEEVRPVGRTAQGVIGIRLEDDDRVVSAEIIEKDSSVLTITEKGYGKRTKLEDYPKYHRGSKGIISINVVETRGNAVGLLLVDDEDIVVLISSDGKVIKIRAKDIPVQGRNTKGVRLIRLEDNARIVSIGKLVEKDDDETEDIKEIISDEENGG